jgi:hypothetical protein
MIYALLNNRTGYRNTIAVCVAGLLAAIPPRAVLASEADLVLDISVNVGPIAVQLNITKPVAHSAGMFSSTLHLHAGDATQTPAFNANLVSTGQAPDPDTLLGGFLPAALIVKKNLLAGMSFQQSVADAQAKTGVTVTFFNDASMVEYATNIMAMVILAVLPALPIIQPRLSDEACTIKTKLEEGLAALGFESVPDPCGTIASHQ